MSDTTTPQHSRPAEQPIRGLLTAVLEALDIPHPATVGDSEIHDRLLADRAMHAVIALRSALDDKPLMDVEWTTTYLRERLAEHPPTGYRHYGTPRTEASQ
ncbi:hypothetical protein [Streptomyces sp. NPDC057909]|uniref:hypothetical protein n=1 Tax=Streptomyces sp. NPDC057909 TaxID=3346277 RepID=UPI0036E80092